MKRLCLMICLIPFAAWSEEIPYKNIEDKAIEALAEIQPRSFEAGVEFCGYILWQNEQIDRTHFEQGEHDSCMPPEPPAGAEVIASFHTHGGHDPDYWSEVPSDADVEGDFEEQVYGFVGTPGGRVWLIDPFQEEIFLICGETCIPQDQNYDASDYPDIPSEMSPDELTELLES